MKWVFSVSFCLLMRVFHSKKEKCRIMAVGVCLVKIGIWFDLELKLKQVEIMSSQIVA